LSTRNLPYREVDYTILQYHGKGVLRYQCDVHAHINEDVGRPIHDAPPIRRKEVEVKPQETVDVRFKYPVRKVTIE